ncbi:MAG: DUF3990 domain-containing protein [Bacilli bacterium]|jgi:hypothetical protein|nr:DUF3990 domain-containing protein [Bacilli bacterium]
MDLKLRYLVSEAVKAYLDAEKKTLDEFSDETKISKVTLYHLLETNEASPKTIEAVYSFLYRFGYRINAVKEEFLKETSKDKLLFHGSKAGLESIISLGARKNCDFGNGFYLGETYAQALAFVCENESSSVYSFSFADRGLKTLKYDVSLDWMLSICHYRGFLRRFDESKHLSGLVRRVAAADLIIAPIADNRMFYIMSLFANGDINSNVALHSLSASRLGLQYIFKTDKALKCLQPIERYYLCEEEREDARAVLNKRAAEIDTKLKLAKREFRDGLFVEELLK